MTAKLQRLVDAIRKLPERDRRRVAAVLRPRRRARPRGGKAIQPPTAYEKLLALSGILRDAPPDVSSRTHEYLADDRLRRR